MSSKWTIFGAFALLALLAAACAVALLKIDIAPAIEAKKGPVRTRNFLEGIRLSQKGLYGVDLVSIGKAHMRKLRKGPFRFGAINELVLEDVSLALPEALWGEKVKGEVRSGAGSAETGRPKAMLNALGINPGHIKMGEKMPRFSALTIRNLNVARIEDGTNAVPWFAASNAKAERGGLVLSSGWSVENGVTNTWKEALLAVAPKLALHCR